MKSAGALFLALMLGATASAQSPADTIRRLDGIWARMYQAHDTATALQLYADDLIVTSTNGTLKDKKTELGDVRPYAGMTVDYFRSLEVDVRMMRDAAVVTGRMEWRTTSNGQSRDIARRYTAVYRRGGPLGWSIAALHVGNAPPR